MVTQLHKHTDTAGHMMLAGAGWSDGLAGRSDGLASSRGLGMVGSSCTAAVARGLFVGHSKKKCLHSFIHSKKKTVQMKSWVHSGFH